MDANAVRFPIYIFLKYSQLPFLAEANLVGMPTRLTVRFHAKAFRAIADAGEK